MKVGVYIDGYNLYYGGTRLATGGISYARFTLSLGVNQKPPEFIVKILSKIGDEEWPEIFTLDKPRRPPPPRIVTASMH